MSVNVESKHGLKHTIICLISSRASAISCSHNRQFSSQVKRCKRIRVSAISCSHECYFSSQVKRCKRNRASTTSCSSWWCGSKRVKKMNEIMLLIHVTSQTMKFIRYSWLPVQRSRLQRTSQFNVLSMRFVWFTLVLKIRFHQNECNKILFRTKKFRQI